MSQNLSFNIKISPDDTVKFEQEATFENFIGQFQLFCSKLLCVIDGTYLRYYNKRHELPTKIRFDYKQRRGKLTEYYFRDIDTDTLYCVFGRDCAKIFYPRIDEVDPSGIHESLIVPPNSVKSQLPEQISSTLPKDISTGNSNFLKNIKDTPVGSSSILPGRTNTNPPEVKQSKPLLSNLVSSKITKSIQPKLNEKDVSSSKGPLYESSQTKRSSIIQARVDNIRPRRSEIIITDRNVRMTFPNPDYPIEVRIYEPT